MHTSEQKLQALRELETQARKIYAAKLALINDIDTAGVAAEYGATSTKALLRDTLRITAASAARHVADAQALYGDGTSAPLAAVADALEHGVVDADQVQVIRRTREALPDQIDQPTREHVESVMVAQAEQYDATRLNRLGKEVRTRLDPDGSLMDDAQASGRETLSFVGDLDGMVAVHGKLTQLSAETVRAALDPLTQPQAAVDGDPDPRTPGKRMADALVELSRRALDGGSLPAQGGQKPHLTLTISHDQLQAETGVCDLDHGGHVSSDEARLLACDGEIALMVLSKKKGVPLDLKRSKRLVTPGLRQALVARDRGCAFPGCDRPPAWCDAHHIIHWIHHGETKLDNLVLLCAKHHSLMHQRGAWRIKLVDGIPHFTPPSYIDWDQTPRRNHLHHPELLFA